LSPSRSAKNGLIVAYERRDGRLAGFSITGHAGFAPAGSDIVCAAVSALVLTAAHGLRAHCGVRPAVADTPRRFSLRLTQRDRRNSRAQAVLATMLSGLEAVARSYPGHVTVRGRTTVQARGGKAHGRQPARRAADGRSRTTRATGPRTQAAKASRSKARRRPSSPADTVER
jgi:uncharacterized protein YsxB (DUF464 family)